ncbi:MAG: peptidoglycan-binding protein [Solirubrobacterales bacterium]
MGEDTKMPDTCALHELKQPELKALCEEKEIEYPKGVISNAELISLIEEGESTWPCKGFDGEQPWADREDPSITVAHEMPILASGSAGAPVFELCGMLAELGYETDVTRGTNAFGVFGPAEAAAVERFRQEHGVLEDPTGFGGESADAVRLAAAHVGPWTWEALRRATGKITS